MNDVQLPTAQQPIGDLASDIGSGGLPPSLRILLDDGFYNRVKQLAGVMSKAVGFTPAHLIDKPEACFAIINISLDAKLSPHFVARHTYQTPSGQIGYDGALVQSILEQSGKFVGAPIFEYAGNWSAIIGKFEKRRNDKGREYVARTWTDKDAVGLGVIVRWFVRGEKHARVWPGEKEPFWLSQCYPLNSPLWATDPKTQIAYLAIRRFANLTSPGILGAAAHDYDEIIDASEAARDVTPPPRPTLDQFVPPEEPTTSPESGSSEQLPDAATVTYEVIDCDGQAWEVPADETEEFITQIFLEASRRGNKAVEGSLEDNDRTIQQLFAAGMFRNGLTVGDRIIFVQPPKQKRHRATKAEMEARRAAQAQQNPADGPQARSPADDGAPSTPSSPQSESASHPEPAAVADPERKPPEARIEARDGAGISSETKAGPSGGGGTPTPSDYVIPMVYEIDRVTKQPAAPAVAFWWQGRVKNRLATVRNVEELNLIIHANAENLDKLQGAALVERKQMLEALQRKLTK